MTVTRRKVDRAQKYIQHRVADVRGGVSIAASELGGDTLPEGAVISHPDEKGICHIVKLGAVLEEVKASDTAIKVSKHSHIKVGDFVTAKPSGAAEAVTAVDSSAKAYDLITVSAAIGAIAAGGYIAEAKAKATSSALKYEPMAINGTTKPVDHSANIDTDAWVIGVTKGLALPDFIAEKLKGIINY